MQLIAVGLVSLSLLGAQEPGSVGLKVGDKLRLHASENGAVPLLESEGHYRGWLQNLRRGWDPGYYMPEVAIPGRLVEVLELKYEKTYALPAPVAVVRIAEGLRKGEIGWVAQQYIRPKGMKAPRGEIRLPEFIVLPNPSYKHRVGDVCSLLAVDRLDIPLAEGRESFGMIAKALAAEGEGRPEKIEGPGIFQGRNDDLVKIVALYPESIRAVEVKIMSGPDEGKYAWAPIRFVVQDEVYMVTTKGGKRGGRRMVSAPLRTPITD